MLPWSAVDLRNRFINVKTSKTGEYVQIPIFPLLYEVLVRLERDDNPYVFPQLATKYQLNPDFITDGVRRVMRVAGFFDPQDAAVSDEERKKSRGELHQARENGLRKASIRDFHSFRVTWVTVALSAGVPLEIVQKVTGHRTAGIVMKHYFQPGREDFRRTLVNKLPAIIGGGPQTNPPDLSEIQRQLRGFIGICTRGEGRGRSVFALHIAGRGHAMTLLGLLDACVFYSKLQELRFVGLRLQRDASIGFIPRSEVGN